MLTITRRTSNDMSHIADSENVQNEDDSNNDESVPQRSVRKGVHRFSDSETEEESLQNEVITSTSIEGKTTHHSDSDSDNRLIPFKSGIARSRIKYSSSDSDNTSRNGAVKYDEQQIRMANKRNKLKNKFKGLLNSREKQTASQINGIQSPEGSRSEVSDPSDSGMSSIAIIKQKIKKSMASISSVCDPDTSDEEGHMNKKEIPKHRKRKEQKYTKLTEPKPFRMSAKQAMENMQLIKSESNRMLREKAVSLPYHRPKALSLKDIMSRRKPAVTLDGKALPIKMNEEQLKHYALLLDQRNKEIMELCRSESDEEEVPATEEQSDELYTKADYLSTNSVSNNIKLDISTEKSMTESIECIGNETIDATMDVDVNANTEIMQEVSVNTIPKVVEIQQNKLQVNELEIIKLSNIETNNEMDRENKNNSDTDLKLVYNDSVEDENVMMDKNESVSEESRLLNKEDDFKDLQSKNESVSQVDTVLNKVHDDCKDLQSNSEPLVTKVNSEPESQLISLHYTENDTETEKLHNPSDENSEKNNTAEDEKQEDFFSDDDVNMDDIDRIIENAEIMKDNDHIISELMNGQSLTAKPKLLGAPGMVIDLDGGAFVAKKLTGVELLKERFTYFSRLKTPEELEREREKKLKPGAQHLKLKQELEEKIAEQRSLEWAKRLEEEKQQHMEMDTILDDAEDSFEKNEAKLEDDDANDDENTSESEQEELEENDVEIKDKPRKHNPMVDDEAEESDDEANNYDSVNEAGEDIDDGDEEFEGEADEENESSDDESSESEEEDSTKVKKGRILKAFEDSDDENVTLSKQDDIETVTIKTLESKAEDTAVISNVAPSSSQDDVMQLAQRHQSASDDLFTSQESSAVVERSKNENSTSDEVLSTQTFSILDSTSKNNNNMDMEFKSPSQINALCISQPYHDPNLNAVVGSQLPITQSSQSQPIGEDILALCTGKFYDNEFVSLSEENQYVDGMSQDSLEINQYNDTQPDQPTVIDEVDKVDHHAKIANINENAGVVENKEPEVSTKSNADGNLLKSILGELDDPELDKPKTNKFFTGGNTQKEKLTDSMNVKKRYIIDSDDETAETNVETDKGKKKKLKKKKPEQRALHISDDEDDEEELEPEDDVVSDLEEGDRLVEYDSEENEIEVKPDKPKKKRKVADFFEQEAELTSEDEWVGSGDEDEKGLDRMEREAGDDEVFHQGKLRRELGQIHMRDVLDQDKREVRLIQELLFEDGDLGGGHRQRKFRWRNAGEGDDTGADNSEFADTQEEEFESEEQWRKQRHEREVFLRQMQEDQDGESLNVSVNRTTIIKANLSSKSMSTLLQEVNQSKIKKTESPDVQGKKTAKDIPSPKKSFSIFQQNYHGSLLTRGRGALARLAALATPLAVDDDAPKIGSLATHKRNFVFTALTPDDDVPKVTMKRKADVNLGTPKLMKKMKIEEKQNRPKSSLLDHLNL